MNFQMMPVETKILFLGNNDESTDNAVTEFAQQNHTVNHGLVTESDFIPQQPGFIIARWLIFRGEVLLNWPRDLIER